MAQKFEIFTGILSGTLPRSMKEGSIKLVVCATGSAMNGELKTCVVLPPPGRTKTKGSR